MKLNNILIGIPFLVLFITSCATHTLDIIGYVAVGDGKNPNNFWFYPDSTFRYRYGSTGVGRLAYGKWKIVGNEIILNSDILDKTVSTSIVKSDDNKTGQIKISIDNVRGLAEDYKCIPYTKEGAFICDPPMGAYVLDLDSAIDSIYFEVYHIPYEFTSTWYSVDVLQTKLVPFNQTINELIFHIDDAVFDYRVFDNTSLKIRGDEIIFIDKDKGNRRSRLRKLPESVWK